MRKMLLCAALTLAGTGCGASATTYVHSPDTTLGRVVVYRNGVAYFERVADVEGSSLKLQVPADKVDDFLKSLTVVDAKTGEPAPIAYPTSPIANGNGLIDMQIQLTGATPHRLRLSYVTEAPSWKPSYRLVVGKNGKVNVQGWAIVDNTSGEDWNGIRLGVGSSSAMSFRFDLRSVRTVSRETLEANDLMALAPPMGGATYGKDDRRVVGELDDGALALADGAPDAANSPASPPQTAAGHHAPTMQPGYHAEGAFGGGGGAGASALSGVAQDLKKAARPGPIVIEGFANGDDKDKYVASLDRANRVRDQLVRSGVDANRIVAVGRGAQNGRNGGVRIVEAKNEAPAKESSKTPAPADANGASAAQPGPQDPIGTSHFESQSAMNVPRGTSAMVSILSAETDGEIVYLYDAETARGNAQFPFRAVRVKNPTDSVLESGPVTVFGDGKFIGEGLSEPIPARSVAFVPFALDRQVVVETKAGESDAIARIITVQRGVFSTEVKHTKKKTLTLYNRTADRASVYVRHTVAPGYTLASTANTTCDGSACEKLAGAHLFRIDLEPHKNTELVIEENTPVFRTTDLRTPEGLDMVRLYLSSGAPKGALKDKVAELVKLHTEMAKIDQQIGTTREQMQEYRVRMDELHAQLVTLKMVRTAGPLMASLERKMQEISDKLSKATVDIVNLEEKRMIARVHFQDGVAELTLESSETGAQAAL